MKKRRFKGCFCSKAFTLIELLIVVLIIGVLAAGAVSQYKKAAMQSYVFRYLTFAKTLVAAQEAYYLANGQYALYFKDLDVNFPSTCKLQDNKYGNMIYCDDSVVIDNSLDKVPRGYIKVIYCPQKAKSFSPCHAAELFHIKFYFQHIADLNNRGKIVCSSGTNSLAKRICTAFNAQHP